jgi:hypothetical protein
MTDDLVKRLREGCSCNFPDTPCGAEDQCRAAFEAADRIEQLEAALRSIAANTCCDKCQEAALVARAALAGEKKDG